MSAKPKNAFVVGLKCDAFHNLEKVSGESLIIIISLFYLRMTFSGFSNQNISTRSLVPLTVMGFWSVLPSMTERGIIY